MFTGIVTDIGTVIKAEQRGDLRLTIRCGYAMDSVAIGASIACSGVCLTVVDKGGDWFAVDVSGETVSKTASDLWCEGARLNLERSLRMGDELGGHIVTGHVDGVADVVEVKEDGGSHRAVLRIPDDLVRFVVTKGSITLDGVSLTINDVRQATHASPYTRALSRCAAIIVARIGRSSGPARYAQPPASPSGRARSASATNSRRYFPMRAWHASIATARAARAHWQPCSMTSKRGACRSSSARKC
jgi:riboflavin synthase